MTQSLYARLRDYRASIAAPFFTSAFDLNLFVARSPNVGKWDDLVLVALLDDAGREWVLQCTATADAWGGEWANPTNPAGCVFTLDQHVPGGFDLGEHKGRPALRQVAPFRYVRWPKANARVPTVAELEALPAQVGVTGCHLHNRASDRMPLVPATDDSEGCVVNLAQWEHAALIRLVQVQSVRHGTAKVSPTFCKRSAIGL